MGQNKRTLFITLLKRLLQKNRSWKGKESAQWGCFTKEELWKPKALVTGRENPASRIYSIFQCTMTHDTYLQKWGILSYSKYWWANNSASLTPILKHFTKENNLFYSFCVTQTPIFGDGTWQSSALAVGRDESGSWVPLSPNSFFPMQQLGLKHGEFKEAKQKLQRSWGPASAAMQHHICSILLVKSSHRAN